MRTAILLFLVAVTPAFAERTEEDFEELVEKIRTDYAIEVRWRKQTYPVKCAAYEIRAKNPKKSQAVAYVDTLEEFLLYPKSLVKLSGLVAIVLVRDMVYKDATYEQERAAIPAFELDTLFLDVTGSGYTLFDRLHVLHHEFFHIVDWRDDGELYSDAAWRALNRKDFKYGAGGAADRDENSGVLTSDYPGFTSKYATSGVEEDKAEMFAYMVIAPETLASYGKKDDVLSAKMRRMESLLRKACTDMNDAWWKKVRALRQERKVPKEE